MDVARWLSIRSRLNRNDQVQASGFTLHETLIVLTVVGILSAGTIGAVTPGLSLLLLPALAPPR